MARIEQVLQIELDFEFVQAMEKFERLRASCTRPLYRDLEEGVLKMATSKSRHAKMPGASVKPVLASDADPQSWLFLNPTGPSPEGTVFGVLRKAYGGRANSAVEFGWRKAHPVAPAKLVVGSPWIVTAERLEVILPGGADDALADPEMLLRQMDACAIDQEKGLLVYLTLPLGNVDRLHVGWELCRAFARERFARDRQLATVLVLHSPGRVGSANPLHCHCLIVPRRLTGRGLAHGEYDTELLHDGGQALVETMWADHLATFR